MKLTQFFEFVKADLETVKSFYLQDELNTKIWDDFNLDSDVREQLIQIGEDFYDKLDLPAEIIDMVLCGSLANYNWSERYSDYDLHIIINYSDVDENFELVEKLCDYAKKVWLNQHDIKIKGYEVEVYIQDEKDLYKSIEDGRMGGVFSLMNNQWIKKPERVEFELDERRILDKAKPIMMTIDDIEDEIDSQDFDSIMDKIDKVWDKIKDIRKRGLEEGSEYSVGNLVFKLLRRNGYIGKVMELKRQVYDKQFK